jgi:peptidoglycan hydrolase-like protein with peptidoglycan-binding domain
VGIDADGAYGPATAAAVSAFKKKRSILNFKGRIDDIVGKKTIAALDVEMAKKETDAPNVVPVLLLAFGVKAPPLPQTTRFRIRTVLLDRPGSTSGNFRFRIYQINDVEHRLAAFYFKGSPERLASIRGVFRSLTAIDKGAFSSLTTKTPVTQIELQTHITETITKTQAGPGRERVKLSLPFFQGGLVVSMEGLLDSSEGIPTIVSSGMMLLIEPSPRHVPK